MCDNYEPVSAFAAYSKLYTLNDSSKNKRKKGSPNKSKAKKQKFDKKKANKKIVVINGVTEKKLNHKNGPKTQSRVKDMKTKNNGINIRGLNKNVHKKKNNGSITELSVRKPVKNGTEVPKETEAFENQKLEYKQKTKVSTSKTTESVSPRNKNNRHITKTSSGYFHVDNYNSVKTGEKLFSWILQPLGVEQFFRDNWEKEPIIVTRKCPKYYSHILSCEEIDTALRKQQLFFTKNIDVTSYTELGSRDTHNPPGRATAPLVWDFYANGCSVRILNPQTFFPKVHALLAGLQEYFGCFVGANVYLTPKDSQGFAPHYDDIEAFVIQLEGEKWWRLYAPRNPSEVLPRFSSGNFKNTDIGEPIKEVLLKAGDMMYFPRGYIHQASASDTHSLHITLSVYQKTSWADLLETLMPAALQSAVEEDISFRKGLPMQYLSHLGLVHSDKPSEIRSQFMKKLQNLITKLVDFAPVDAAVDQLGKKFIHDCLPPFLSSDEKETTVFEDGDRNKNGIVHSQAEMCLGTKVKLIRYNCIRMLQEEDSIRIYYSINNSKEYHGEEPQYLEIDEALAPIVDALISSYPQYICVEDFPIDDDIAKVSVAISLWEIGILKTDSPLSYMSD